MSAQASTLPLRRTGIGIVIVVAAMLVAVSCTGQEPQSPKPAKYKNQVVEFADPCLERAIRRQLERSDGDIWSDELAEIDRLHIRGNSIDLNGEHVEYAPHRGQMTTLTDLKWFTDLTDLALEELGISSDLSPLAELTNLTSLNLEGNRVSDLSALTGLTGLQSLELGSNQVYDIGPLAGLTKLERLSLRGNYIARLSSLTMPHLTHLDLSHNQIRSLSPLSALTGLQYLQLDSNQISDISPLAALSDLTYLCLNSNHISDLISLAGLPKLRHLEVCCNGIADWSPVEDVTVVIGETEQLVLLGKQIVEAIHARDCLFLRDNARNVEVGNEGIVYSCAGERVEVPFPKHQSRPDTMVRFVRRKSDDEIIVGYEASSETCENIGVFHIGFVKRDGVWKMEWVATDI